MLHPVLSSPASLPAALLAEGAPAGGGLGSLLPILLMFVVIYFIVLRPMSQEEKGRKKRVGEVKKGDEVVLQSGVIGRISNFDDPKIAIVEIGTDKKLKVKVLKKNIQDTAAEALKDDPRDAKAKAKDNKDAKDDKSGDSKDKARKGA